MSFSASTCLTYTGNTPLGGTLYFYSDFDSYTTPFGSVATNLIIGGNCPYIITGIPDGTTIIRLRDYTSGCCVDIPIQSSDLCIVCNLQFDVISATTVSQIVAGNLLTTCEDQVNDYVVYWYGPNSSTNVGYTSGLGNQFSYQFTHPLTGTSAIFAQAGTYTPVIDKIISNGVTFSQTGGTGYYMANTECFSPVTVEALKCNNGNTVGDYSHTYNFSAAASGVQPQPLSASFELSANTKFFPYEFQAYSVYDKLDITLISSNYSEPIKLESISIGQDAPYYDLYSFPRNFPSSGLFKRVLTLTGFTISSGDYLTIEITPNSANTQTNWFFGCKCLTTFDCSGCLLNNFMDNPYPILLSSVTGTTGTCNATNIAFTLSGCNFSNSNDDFLKYVNAFPSQLPYPSIDGLYPLNYMNLFKWSGTTCYYGGGYSGPNCRTPNTNTITYEKSVVGGIGKITITCDVYSDLESFYNEYNIYYGLYSGSPTNPLSTQYYRAITLFVPTPLTNNCGDGTTFDYFPIHTSSIVTTGGTGPWFISFTMPTIFKGISFTECEVGCDYAVQYIVDSINNSSTGTSNNFVGTTYTGSKFDYGTQFQPSYFNLNYNNNPYTASTFTNGTYFYDYNYKTIPWSGLSNTYIPNLSGQTCFLPNSLTGDTSGAFGPFKTKWYYYYTLELTNPNSITDFNIYGARIINGAYSGYPGSPNLELVVQFSGGSVVYSNPYFVI